MYVCGMVREQLVSDMQPICCTTSADVHAKAPKAMGVGSVGEGVVTLLHSEVMEDETNCKL